MNEAVSVMLKNYGPIRSPSDEDNALKEIIQQITLLGLHRGGFFEKCSFYGGTALRILYGLDRFSEDMDFCLNEPDGNFSLRPYFTAISDELSRFEFNAKIEEKNTGPGAAIESAFVKQDTYSGLIIIGRNQRRAQKGQLLKVKLEIDKKNPPGFNSCKKLVKLPVAFMVRTLTEPSLLAGKIHALIARAYVNRVKGRDFYDFLFFMARGTPVNIQYLEAKLRDSGHYTKSEKLSREGLLEILIGKIAKTDFEKAKSDIMPFIRSEKRVSINDWSPELFIALAQEIVIEKS